MKKLLIILVTIIGSSSQAGLFGGGYLRKASGHHEGSYTLNVDGKFSRQSVQSDIGKDSTILVKDESDNVVLTLVLSDLGISSFVINGPYIDSNTKLRRGKGEDEDCFLDNSSQRVRFCFYRDLLVLEVTDGKFNPIYNLALGKFAVEKSLPPEPPQAYDLSAAVNRSLKHNFDNRIEFEHVMQAKFGARAAKLNLLPHISFSTIVGNLTPTVYSVIAAAGDLLPFLFPTRWLQVFKTKNQNEAEIDAMTLMRMDTTQQVEAFFYNYENDRTVRDAYKEILTISKAVLKAVEDREILGVLPPGATDNLKSKVNFIEQSYAVMDAILQEDLAAISQVMGFYNPKAVLDAKLGSEDRLISNAKPVDPEEVQNIAVKRSVELRQLDFLIAAAKDSKWMVIWNWLDPTGDPTMNLGLNLHSNYLVAKSQVQEIQIRRSQMSQLLKNRAFVAAMDFNKSLKEYIAVANGSQIQKRRLVLLDKLLRTQGKIDLSNLMDVFNDYLTVVVNEQTNILNYRTARARLDRLLLQGAYVIGLEPPQIKREK